jgi:hypothetical protein
VQELELPKAAELLLGPSGTLLALQGQPRGPSTESVPLELALFDLSGPAPARVATGSVPLDDRGRVVRFWPRHAVLLDDVVRLGDGDSPETALLLVPKMSTDRHAFDESIVMVSIGTSTLTVRGELERAFAPLHAGDRLYTARHDRLRMFELDGAALPSAIAGDLLWPVASGGWLVSDVIAVQRGVGGDPWAEAPAFRLEIVARAEHDPRESLGYAAIAGEGFVFRAGERIVALEPTDHWAEDTPPALRVFELDERSALHEVGRLQGGGLPRDWVPPYRGVGWGATDDALILHVERFGRDADNGYPVFDFQVIDLRDPSAPSLHEIAMPGAHRSAGALFAGETVYYTYALPTEGGSAQRPEVRYYLQTIDVSDPGSPLASEPVNVPGQVIAIDGDALYLRDAHWDGDGLRYFVRRVEVEEGVARITGSREIPQRPHSAHVTGAGDLAVTLVAPVCLYCREDDATLLLLSGTGLEVRGELELEGPCDVIGEAGDTLVVSSPYENVQLIDVSQPDAPALARLIRHARVADLRGSDLLISRSGALIRLDLVRE